MPALPAGDRATRAGADPPALSAMPRPTPRRGRAPDDHDPRIAGQHPARLGHVTSIATTVACVVSLGSGIGSRVGLDAPGLRPTALRHRRRHHEIRAHGSVTRSPARCTPPGSAATNLSVAGASAESAVSLGERTLPHPMWSSHLSKPPIERSATVTLDTPPPLLSVQATPTTRWRIRVRRAAPTRIRKRVARSDPDRSTSGWALASTGDERTRRRPAPLRLARARVRADYDRLSAAAEEMAGSHQGSYVQGGGSWPLRARGAVARLSSIVTQSRGGRRRSAGGRYRCNTSQA